MVIAFVGPEGAGKTFYTEYFAKFFQVDFAQEIGDWYCRTILKGYYVNQKFLTNKKIYNEIVRLQKDTWQKLLNKDHKYIFFDTDLIFTKYFIDKQFVNWTWIDYEIAKQPIDLYLFLNPKKFFIKDHNLITQETAQRETNRLLNYYRYLVNDKLIVVDCEETHDETKIKITKILNKYFKK